MPQHPADIQRLSIIDSHTGGEPTRVVIAGGPDLRGESLAEQLADLQSQHDWLRKACVNEPRGNDAIVGALLCPPTHRDAVAGVIFFNNVGYLNMCGHGSIGLAVTLSHMGRINPGTHTIQTPVGEVAVTLHGDRRRVSIENVPSYRYRDAVALHVPGIGTVHGDIAWGGNWFFLTADHGLCIEPQAIKDLTDASWAIRHALEASGITGKDGGLIDHIELIGPPGSTADEDTDADARIFVLCPGGAYDRSPCGTGTSAKLACLAAEGKLAPGDIWRQQSITGSVFEATYRPGPDDTVLPTITGSAHITAQATFIIDPEDPLSRP